MLLALTMAQTFFSIGLAVITVFIVLFAAYVVSTTLWADRWVRRRRP